MSQPRMWSDEFHAASSEFKKYGVISQLQSEAATRVGDWRRSPFRYSETEGGEHLYDLLPGTDISAMSSDAKNRLKDQTERMRVLKRDEFMRKRDIGLVSELIQEGYLSTSDLPLVAAHLARIYENDPRESYTHHIYADSDASWELRDKFAVYAQPGGDSALELLEQLNLTKPVNKDEVYLYKGFKSHDPYDVDVAYPSSFVASNLALPAYFAHPDDVLMATRESQGGIWTPEGMYILGNKGHGVEGLDWRDTPWATDHNREFGYIAIYKTNRDQFLKNSYNMNAVQSKITHEALRLGGRYGLPFTAMQEIGRARQELGRKLVTRGARLGDYSGFPAALRKYMYEEGDTATKPYAILRGRDVAVDDEQIAILEPQVFLEEVELVGVATTDFIECVLTEYLHNDYIDQGLLSGGAATGSPPFYHDIANAFGAKDIAGELSVLEKFDPFWSPGQEYNPFISEGLVGTAWGSGGDTALLRRLSGLSLEGPAPMQEFDDVMQTIQGYDFGPLDE